MGNLIKNSLSNTRQLFPNFEESMADESKKDLMLK